MILLVWSVPNQSKHKCDKSLGKWFRVHNHDHNAYMTYVSPTFVFMLLINMALAIILCSNYILCNTTITFKVDVNLKFYILMI